MGARPEEIRTEIEETRDRISAEIDELTARYSPRGIAERKTAGAREAAASMRAKVGSGTGGMKERLSLRHHHTDLGKGHTGNGEAHAAGARMATADARARRKGVRVDEKETQQRRGLLRRLNKDTDTPKGTVTRTTTTYTAPDGTTRTVSGPPLPPAPPGTYGPGGGETYRTSYPSGREIREPATASYQPGGREKPTTYRTTTTEYRTVPEDNRPLASRGQPFGQQQFPSGGTGQQQFTGPRPVRDEDMARREQRDMSRVDEGERAKQQPERPSVIRRHARDFGIAGASAAMAAAGTRLLRRPGRQETTWIAAAESKRPYQWFRPASDSGIAAPSAAHTPSSSMQAARAFSSMAAKGALRAAKAARSAKSASSAAPPVASSPVKRGK